MLIARLTGEVFLMNSAEPNFLYQSLHPHRVHSIPVMPNLTAQQPIGAERPLEIERVELSKQFEVGP